MAQGVTTASYKYPRTSRNKTSFVDTHQPKIDQINYFSNRHETAISYLLKIGGCRLEEVELWVGEVGIANQTMIALLQEIWEVLLKKEHNHFSQLNTLPVP